MKRSNIFFFTIALIAIFLVGAITYSNPQEKKKPDLADFEITIQQTEDGIELTCPKGCSWEQLSYKGFDNGHVQKIDEHGMTANSSKK